MPGIPWIRKRDGRQVPFDALRITDAIFAAIQSVGEGDRGLAEELAEAVTLHLEQHHADAVPGIEDIQDLVERVLIETGHARVAKSYILYRDERARLRDALRVRRQVEKGDYDTSDHPQVALGGGERIEGWSKARIAAALVREAGLDTDTATEVARSVEKKVFSSGVKTIPTSLIRELADNELFERGLQTSLHRQARVGIPKYDLEGILLEGGKDVSTLSTRIGNRILKDYVLEEAFSKEVVQAHRLGSLHIHGLEAPLSLLDATIRLPEGGGETDAEAMDRIRERLLAVDPSVSRSLHLGEYGTVRVGPDLFSRPSIYPALRGDWVHRPEGGLHLNVPLARLARTDRPGVEEILSVPFAGGFEATLVLEVTGADLEKEACRAALEIGARLLAGGRRIALRWTPTPAEEVVVLHEVTLNLPRAASIAGAGHFTSFLEEAHGLIARGRQALLEADRFRERTRGRLGPAPPLPGAKEIHRLSVVGLADAIHGIVGADPALGGKAWELHLEAIRNIVEAVEDLEGLGGVPVSLGGVGPQVAAARLAHVDLATRQGYPRPSPSPTYADGFHLRTGLPTSLGDRIARETEIAREAGFGDLVVPRFTDGPPSAEEVYDVLLQTRGYPGVVRVAGMFVPIPEE